MLRTNIHLGTSIKREALRLVACEFYSWFGHTCKNASHSSLIWHSGFRVGSRNDSQAQHLGMMGNCGDKNEHTLGWTFYWALFFQALFCRVYLQFTSCSPNTKSELVLSIIFLKVFFPTLSSFLGIPYIDKLYRLPRLPNVLFYVMVVLMIACECRRSISQKC